MNRKRSCKRIYQEVKKQERILNEHSKMTSIISFQSILRLSILCIFKIREGRPHPPGPPFVTRPAESLGVFDIISASSRRLEVSTEPLAAPLPTIKTCRPWRVPFDRILIQACIQRVVSSSGVPLGEASVTLGTLPREPR